MDGGNGVDYRERSDASGEEATYQYAVKYECAKSLGKTIARQRRTRV